MFFVFFFFFFFFIFLFFLFFFFFFFNDTATTEIYTLSLHDALPIYGLQHACCGFGHWRFQSRRSEEHTSELQSRENLVCRLLLEKKKKKITHYYYSKNKKKNNNIKITYKVS